NRAILGTIARVLILRWGAFYALMVALEVLSRMSGRGLSQLDGDFPIYFWFGIGLANNLLFGVWWARRHLLNDFREAATQRYQPGRIGWFSRATRRKHAALVSENAAMALD